MVTVKGSTGRKYEVRSTLYGTQNLVNRLYYGDIYLASTGDRSESGASSTSMEETIKIADIRAEKLGVEITD